MSGIAVFSGSAHRGLAEEVCEALGVELQPSRIERYATDCIEIQLQTSCRERDVFLIQPLAAPVQEHLMELLLMADAARGASAARITAVIPYYAYGRSDKKVAPRISIGARLVADLLATAGVNRVLTMALHSPQVHGFFSMPVDHLHALRQLAGHCGRADLSDSVVVSPDLGNAKSASAFARILGVPVAAGTKERLSDEKVVISAIMGDVQDHDIIVLDDEIARGSSVFELLDRLKERGARQSRVVCTHGLFAGQALRRLEEHPDVLEVVCTNTVPVEANQSSKLTVISVAPVLGDAIRRIHDGESVSALFDLR